MKGNSLVLLATLVIVPMLYGQDKKPADPPKPTLTAEEKLAITTDERDIAQYQAQLGQLQAAYNDAQNKMRDLSAHAQGLVDAANKKAGDKWTLDTKSLEFVAKPTPPPASEKK